MDAANTERNIILGYMAMCGYQYKWAKPNICSGLWQCFKQCVREQVLVKIDSGHLSQVGLLVHGSLSHEQDDGLLVLN